MRKLICKFQKGERQGYTLRRLQSWFIVALVFLGFVLGPFFIIQAKAAPVIIDEDNSGSWSDCYTDSTGIESQNNLEINPKCIKLAFETDILWDHEYTANVEPDIEGWNLFNNTANDMASVSDGFLTLDTTSENKWWWYTYGWGASNTIGATFEARMKVIADSQIGIINWLRDGTYTEGIKFYENRIEMYDDNFNNYYMDTTDGFHVYRFTVKNNDYMVYVDGALVIDGTGQHDLSTTGNVCTFGDHLDNAGYDAITVWDFVRFNVSGAFPATPLGFNTTGNLVSTEISHPPGMAWDSMIINKTEPGIDNFINVSVLDSTTSEVILGFENLTDSNIDLSGIDHITYPKIKLLANFEGNYSDTPILHDWTVTWADTIPPATPAGFTVNNPFTGYSQVLSWNSNTEKDLSGYGLYYSTDNITFNWLINITTGTVSFIHYGLSSGITYYYKIAAFDDVPNQSPFSNVVNGTPDLDYDGDGIGNMDDMDDDNDGIPDISDPYPLNPFNDMEITIDYINKTVNKIQSDLETMNITEMVNILNFLNQTIPVKINDLSIKLTNVKDNLSSELGEVNLSLSSDIQNLLENITSDIRDINTSLTDQLSSFENYVKEFNDHLQNDISNISYNLQLHDEETGQNHSTIIDMLENIRSVKLQDMKTMLIDLAGNLSAHNLSIVNDILGVVNDIEAFEENSTIKLEEIDNTLVELQKLEDILDDFEELDDKVDTVHEEEKETQEKIDFVDLLSILILILLLVNIILTFVVGKGKKGTAEIPKASQGEVARQEIPSQPITQERENEGISEERGFPPPPPLTE